MDKTDDSTARRCEDPEQKALLQISPGDSEPQLRFAAQVLLDSIAPGVSLGCNTSADTGSGLVLPGGTSVPPAELRAVFASVTLQRELETGRQDRLGRFDETAATWNTTKPWVDLRAAEIAAQADGLLRFATNDGATFSVHITHDVDRTTLCEPFSLAKSALGALGARQPGSAYFAALIGSNALLKGLERLLDYERAMGVGARFFLTSGPFSLGRHGTRTDTRWASWKASARLIEEAGMSIGLHGGFSAKDRASYGEERERLEQAIGRAVTTHRNHYLRFDTVQICEQLEAAGIEHDFGFGYATRLGFRSGCAHVHRMFDLKGQRESRLKAVPLLFMDSNLVSGDQAVVFRELQAALIQVKNVGGAVSLLFHPEILLLGPGAWDFFDSVVSLCAQMGADLSGSLV